jgi:hypothetical protein
VLVREAVTDVAVKVSTFRIGEQKLLVAGGRYAKVEITFSAAKLDLKMATGGIVVGPSQESGFQGHTHRRSSEDDCRKDLAKTF